MTSTAYLPFGPASQLVFGNGTTQTMSFDARYRWSENKLTAGATTLADYTYTSDASATSPPSTTPSTRPATATSRTTT